MKKVAVIVLNYNGKHLLKESLGSLVKQTYKDCQLYLADDGSTDDSLVFVRKNFPQVKIIPAPKRMGIDAVFNYAVARTKEKFLVMACNDIKFHHKALEILVQTIMSDPQIGICTSLIIRRNTDFIDNAGGEVDVYGFAMPHGQGQPWKSYPDKTEEVFFSYGGFSIMKREIYLRVGKYDDKMWALSDDIDLSWRFRLLGYKIVVNPKSFLFHRGSATLNKERRELMRYLSERNSLRMLLKNYSLVSLFKIIPRYLFLEFGEITLFAFRGKFSLSMAVARAIFWNIRNFSDTLKLRKKIQKIRKVNDGEIFSMMNKFSFKLKILPAMIRAGHV